MFKLINQTKSSYQNLKILRKISCDLKKDSRLIFTPKRLQSIDASKNASLNNPLNKNSQKPNSEKDNSLKKLLAVFASGALAYFSISYYLENRKTSAPSFEINYESKNLPGKIKPSKSINRGKNPGNLKITLYQYVTCPFCCKVRAYLDYYGYSYDIVEVNSINKSQLDWSGYKKVPTLAIQYPSKTNPEELDPNILQLNESSVIVSALETFRLDPSTPLSQVIKYFEPIEVDSNEKNKKTDFVNKYFVMLHSDKMTDGKDVSERKDERDWRKWVDNKFIHVISPNVYRTVSETLAAFNWYDQVGDWKNNFSEFQRSSIKYVGSTVMFILGKTLKKKYNLKEDVRVSMYEMCDEWVNSLKGTFMGGSRPNLSDLALYGAITSYEGCPAFQDMMTHSKIKQWFDSCKEQVENSKGAFFLDNPDKLSDAQIKQNLQKEENLNKKNKRFILF